MLRCCLAAASTNSQPQQLEPCFDPAREHCQAVPSAVLVRGIQCNSARPCGGQVAWRTFLSTHDTMPAVTLLCRCRGLPSASTHSPTLRPALVPSRAQGRGSLLSTFTIAKSVALHARSSKLIS